jgi:hypothetical protein
MHQGVTFGDQPSGSSGGSGGFEVSRDADGDDGTAQPDPPDNGGLAAESLRALGGGQDLRGRIGAWRALLDRPLTSY